MINLLPASEKNRRQHTNQSLAIIIMSIAVIMITLIVGIVFDNINNTYEIQAKEKENTAADLGAKIQKSKAIQNSMSQQINAINTVVQLSEERILWSKVISEFSKVVPQDAKVSSFAATKKPIAFTISAETMTRKDVEEFRKRVEDSPYFKNAFYNSTTETGEGESTRVSFGLTFEWETPEINQNKK